MIPFDRGGTSENRNRYPPWSLHCIAFGHHWVEGNLTRVRVTLTCHRCGGRASIPIMNIKGAYTFVEDVAPTLIQHFRPPSDDWPVGLTPDDALTILLATKEPYRDETE